MADSPLTPATPVHSSISESRLLTSPRATLYYPLSMGHQNKTVHFEARRSRAEGVPPARRDTPMARVVEAGEQTLQFFEPARQRGG